ncbi:MAG: competence/damage-inducible protein A [Deltaproteobacteria bacterium]|nr:competence/damage-inducible protein A [Deltaproteobacteria bacterium]
MTHSSNPRRIEIVATGEELLMGKTIDTNSAHVAQQVAKVGFAVNRVTLVGDAEDDIADALEKAMARTGLVVVTGGLGPTDDDRTRFAAARVFDRKIITSNPSLNRLKERWASVGREMPESNVRQAQFPSDAEIWQNMMGTADGFRCVGMDGKEGIGEACFMPGVPFELEDMTERYVLPWLRSKGGDAQVRSHMVRLFGLPESKVQEILGRDWPAADSGVSLIYGAAFPEIKLTLSTRADDAETADRLLGEATHYVREKIGDKIFSEDGKTLAETVADYLTRAGKTIALAESCTGGMIAAALTDVPGSSAYFLESDVTYANEAKVRRLGVSEATLAEHGAVSFECAHEMAEGILERSGADIALAVTGIAGPDGGTPEKPVGTVFVALAVKGEDTTVHPRHWPGDRARIRTITTFWALDLVRRQVSVLEK